MRQSWWTLFGRNSIVDEFENNKIKLQFVLNQKVYTLYSVQYKKCNIIYYIFT